MIFPRDITTRETGLALSGVTVLVLAVGYGAVQWLSGSWQPPALEQASGALQVNTSPIEPPPLILKSSAPHGAITTGWELPLEEPPIDTALREREIR